MSTSVDIAIPAYGAQPHYWWLPLMERYSLWRRDIPGRLIVSSSAMPDTSKNMSIGSMLGNNDSLTSHNRNRLVDEFESEWIFFIDHDTLPPVDALPRLLALQRPIVAGVYYHRNEPHMPLMYRQQANGLYRVVSDYERGALIEVDATGMGCTLIHRDVFIDIMNNYVRLVRSNGTSFLVHKDDIADQPLASRFRTDAPVVFGDERGLHYVEPVKPFVEPNPGKRTEFPFFDMEHGRTEDIPFCERARRVGYSIYVDTSVECEHWHMFPVTGDHFAGLRAEAKLSGEIQAAIAPGGMVS